MKQDLFMVFDVESIGLHGEGFAAAFVVESREGKTLDQGCISCDPRIAQGTDESRLWVAENVPPLAFQYGSPREVREEFWRRWLYWKEQGAVLAADCAWPVEARFLSAAVDDYHQGREWEGPYPLHDLASVLLALGLDPLATNARQADELPAHHPLMDARKSARLLVAALKTYNLMSGAKVRPILAA